jgi:hypothetical protein
MGRIFAKFEVMESSTLRPQVSLTRRNSAGDRPVSDPAVEHFELSQFPITKIALTEGGRPDRTIVSCLIPVCGLRLYGTMPAS